jgi:maleamate amidohydrolase
MGCRLLIKVMHQVTRRFEMTMDKYAIYQHQGLGGTSGIGRRCALILVDFVNGFVDVDQLGGPHIQAAADQTVALLAYFRAHGLPIVHTRVVFSSDGADRNIFAFRVPPLQKLTEQAHASQIVPQLEPQGGEWVIRKQSASAFFETGLAGWLLQRGVDTAVITGCTTSGCVRASVVDAMQHNLRTLVISDCVGDRALEPHVANLFDMQQKYADVMTRDEFITQHQATTACN